MKLVSIRSVWSLVTAVVALLVVALCGHYLWEVHQYASMSDAITGIVLIPVSMAGVVFGAGILVWSLVEYIIIVEENL